MRAYNSPGAWFGWHGWADRPQPMSVTELIAAGSLSAELASLLWLLLEQGTSIIVASPPRLAGKTTTLTALLTFLPDAALGYFSSGMMEPFDVPPLEDGAPTYLMINELSDHLPIYTWGFAAARAFELLGEGYALAATMHAEDAAQALAILERGLGVPRVLLARLGIVLSLRYRLDGRHEDRHASELALVGPDGDGYRIDVLGGRAPADAAFTLGPDAADIVAVRLSHDAGELRADHAERRALLEGLVAQGTVDQDAVHEAVRNFMRKRG